MSRPVLVYRSPKFFARAGLFLRVGRRWFRVVPL